MTGHPTDIVAKYVQAKRIALARQLRPVKKIYLDTKYWALLRDVRMGRLQSKALTELLDILHKLVNEGIAICPLNADIYFEIFKQNDPKTLRASVELMDDLSSGVSLISMPERLNTEMFQFVESILFGADRVFSLDELMWTKAAYIIGFVTPNCYDLPASENVLIQQSFADFMWELRLVDLLDTLGDEAAANHVCAFKDISSELNDGKFGSIGEHATFRSLYLCEIRGLLDAQLDELTSLIAYITERDARQRSPHDATNSTGRVLANLIHEAFRLERIGRYLPSLRVGAGLHAALRWDRKRKYKPNDQFDFRHAEAALPYCDYFFTERSLKHLVNDGNLNFSDAFECVVCSDAEEAVASLSLLTQLA